MKFGAKAEYTDEIARYLAWRYWYHRKRRGEMKMHDEPLMFMDCTCPGCGRTAGNGGHGYTFRCVCGWMGKGISQHDEKLIEQALARFRKKNTEETT